MRWHLGCKALRSEESFAKALAEKVSDFEIKRRINVGFMNVLNGHLTILRPLFSDAEHFTRMI